MVQLLDLPDEMLLKVKSHIHTLEGHVYFSQTCRTFAGLYPDDEKFWQPAMILAGWGIPKRYKARLDKAGIKAPWRALAFAVVKDAAHFRCFPALGGRTLRETIFEEALGRTDLDQAADSKLVPTCALAMDRDVNASFYAVWGADNADAVFEVSFDMMAECLDSDALPRELDFMTNKQSKEADRDADARRARRPHNEEGMGEHGDEGVEPDFSDLPGENLSPIRCPYLYARLLTKPHCTPFLVDPMPGTSYPVSVRNSAGVTTGDVLQSVGPQLLACFQSLTDEYGDVRTGHVWYEGIFLERDGSMRMAWGS